MSAHNPPANRRTDRDSEPLSDQDDKPLHESEGEPHLESTAEAEVSTRVLLDSGTPPSCDACGDTIELNARHKYLTVRDGADLWEFTFCDEACLAGKRDQL